MAALSFTSQKQIIQRLLLFMPVQTTAFFSFVTVDLGFTLFLYA
jgi:hypothetical protein